MPNGNGTTSGGGSPGGSGGSEGSANFWAGVVRFIANLVEALGIRGSTQHFSWAEAQSFANQWEGRLRAIWEPLIPPGDLPAVTRHYGQRLREIMLSGTYWGRENVWSADSAFDLIGAPSEGWVQRLARLVWLHAGWVAIHVDRERFQYQFAEFFTATLRQSSSVESPTPGRSNGLFEIIGGASTTTTGGGVGVGGGTGSGTSTAGMSNGGKVALVVGLGALAFWGVPKLLSKGE